VQPPKLTALLAIILTAAGSFPAGAASLGLLVLGSGGPRPFGRASTSYLVEVDGTPRVLIDAGPGAFLRLGELNASLEHVDTVLLTHLHIDHTGDLPAMLLARTLTARTPAVRLTVFGPAAAGQFPNTSRFLNLLFENAGAWEYEKTFGADQTLHAVDLPIDLKSPQRQIAELNSIRISAIATHHGDCPSVAYRIDYNNESIVFSGDMDPSALPNLIKLAKGCSLLVFHCVVLDQPNSPAQLYALHTPPKPIGEAARDAGAKQLLLSHIAPAIEDASQSVLASIKASYKGPVTFAHDKTVVSLQP
jgi:ribonuclease BN (tRNA processing enzyme)